jgi:hypothetical protein
MMKNYLILFWLIHKHENYFSKLRTGGIDSPRAPSVDKPLNDVILTSTSGYCYKEVIGNH